MEETQELPHGWIWTRIGEIASTSSGGTPSRSNPSYFTGNIPWIKSGELGDGYVVEYSESISAAALAGSSAKLFPKGTLLIALYGATVGKVGILTMDAATNQAVCGIFLPPWVELKFAFNYLFSLRREFIEQGKGGAQPNISQDIVRNTLFPLPPLPEQRRIVAKLEELFSRLDAGVAAVRRTQALLKRYRQSVLHAAVTGELTRAWREAHPAPTETGAALLTRIRAERRAQWEAAQSAKRGGQLPLNIAWKSRYVAPSAPETSGLPELPESWSWATFEEISERVTVGFVGSMKDEYVEEGVPFLRSQNVRENNYSPLGLKYVSPAFDESISKSRLEPGDVVVVRSGSVGTACVIPDSLPAANCSDLVIVKQPKVLPEYCAYYMNSVAKARVNAQKVGVALIHFNTQAQAAMPLSIPPVDEQAEIVAEVERRLTVLDALSQTLTAELKRAERLRQSLLHRAFTGRLVPQDATDEPAAALLARLHATPAAPAKAKAGRERKAPAQQTNLGL